MIGRSIEVFKSLVVKMIADKSEVVVLGKADYGIMRSVWTGGNWSMPKSSCGEW